MAVPSHGLITWSGCYGTPGSPYEEWQFSLKHIGGETPSVPDTDPISWQNQWATHLAPLFHQDIHLTQTQHVVVDEGGKWARNNDGSYQGLTRNSCDVSGTRAGSFGAFLPSSVALCVSLASERPDATGKGRFYLPTPAYGLDSDRRYADSTIALILPAVKGFIEGINDRLGSNNAIAVFSSKGYASRVTRVKVGKVPDTQRRRRGDMLEGYASATLALAAP
jgi:hypothetical protein